MQPLRRLPLVNAVVVDMPATALLAASSLAEVERVDDDLLLRATDLPAPERPGGAEVGSDQGAADREGEGRAGEGGGCLPALLALPGRLRCRRPPPGQRVPWGVGFVRAPGAWARSRGQGVKVAVVDTGVDLRHPDLQGRLAGGYNALRPGRDPADDNGHGTHVAGTAAASDDAGGVVGVAPEAHLYAVKVLDAFGSGMLSDLVDGLHWCLGEGIQVVNMSLGSEHTNATFAEAIRRAHEGGLLLVAAAGNSGPGQDTVQYPARYPETVSVSAINAGGSMPDFASRGPRVDILAPGQDVLSDWPGGGLRTLSGTSMAAPHVSGAAALLLAAKGPLPPDEVRLRLRQAGRPVAGYPWRALDALALLG